MARVSTYLNFPGTTEEAFEHYRSVFGTSYVRPIMRFSDMSGEGGPELSPADAGKVAHVELEILAGHVLMGTDMLGSMGQECRVGNNTTIVLELDRREDADRLYAGLDGGTEHSAPQLMSWGQYWGTCLDRFGIRWMFTAD